MKKYINLVLISSLFYIVISCLNSNSNKYEYEPLLLKKQPFPKYFPDNMVIYVTADIEGNLEPCGCRAGQFGGLPRQAQFIVTNRDNNKDLLLDLGNLINENINSYELYKYTYILKVYERLNYDAVNLGYNEAKIPYNKLNIILKKYAINFISCNLLNKKHELITSPFIIKKINGINIGILGILDKISEDKIGKGVYINDPIESLKKYLPIISQKSQIIIIAGCLKEKTCDKILNQFPQIDILLNTKDTPTLLPDKINNVVFSSLSSKGRMIQEIRIGLIKDGINWVTGRNILLKEDIQDHKGTRYILEQYKRNLSQRKFYLKNLLKAKDKYVGVKVCKKCHEQEFKIWEKTAHAHSLNSLKEKNSEHDPYCLQCHVTGYKKISGYRGEKETPTLAFVGCEVCHGPGRKHSFYNSKEEIPPLTTNQFPKKACLECHTWEHCKNFQFEKFWEKIKHGKKNK